MNTPALAFQRNPRSTFSGKSVIGEIRMIQKIQHDFSTTLLLNSQGMGYLGSEGHAEFKNPCKGRFDCEFL